MSISRIQLIKHIARQIKYRELTEYVGQSVVINHIDTIEADLKGALTPMLPMESHLLPKERRYIEVALAKYGLIDLMFQASGTVLESNYSSGMSVLKDAKFFPEGRFDDPETAEISIVALGMCAEELARSLVYAKLFLHVCEKHQTRLKLEPDYLPRKFVINDFCVTNMPSIWINKYFYL